jgi:hypothetical protein
MEDRVTTRSAPPRRLSIGIDVAKDTHWVTAMTDLGEIVFD